MSERKPISKRLRFEVFKRDSFKCSYCGRAAPDVILHCDHIVAVSNGGANSISNLVTSCADCNSGKSNIPLSDDSAAQVARNQAEMFQERRNQLKMMLEWQRGAIEIENEAIKHLSTIWEQLTACTLTEHGIRGLLKLSKEFSFAQISDAMRKASAKYLEHDRAGNVVLDSCNVAFKRIGGICHLSQIDDDDPNYHRLYYIRGILRNRFNLGQNDSRTAISLLRTAYDSATWEISDLENLAKSCNGMAQFVREIQE